MIELELTYLAKSLPENLSELPCREIIDVYFPKESAHPTLRLRKNGEKYEMTKKQPVREGDASEQEEQTIRLEKAEFEALSKVEGKRVRKLRYAYGVGGRTAEIDVFQDALKGLVVVDFEFESEEEKASFTMPDFCLADITQDTFIAGGMICGKAYEDVESKLKGYGYSRLEV